MKVTAIFLVMVIVAVTAAKAAETSVCPTCTSAEQIPIPHCSEHIEAYPPTSFQIDKAQRVKDAVEQSKGNAPKMDLDPPGDFVELLLCVAKDGDENSVLALMDSVMVEVLERNMEYLPGIVKVRVGKEDKDLVIERLSKDPFVAYVEENVYLELQ